MTILKTASAMTGMALLGGLLMVNVQEKLLRPVSLSVPSIDAAKSDTPPVELKSSRDLTPGWLDSLTAPVCVSAPPEPEPPRAAAPPEVPKAGRKTRPEIHLPIPR